MFLKSWTLDVVTEVGFLKEKESKLQIIFFSNLASSDFCRLLITFANSLDPDQDRHNGGPDLGSNHLTL